MIDDALSPTYTPPTKVSDLTGFWEMVQIQVSYFLPTVLNQVTITLCIEYLLKYLLRFVQPYSDRYWNKIQLRNTVPF